MLRQGGFVLPDDSRKCRDDSIHIGEYPRLAPAQRGESGGASTRPVVDANRAAVTPGKQLNFVHSAKMNAAEHLVAIAHTVPHPPERLPGEGVAWLPVKRAGR